MCAVETTYSLVSARATLSSVGYISASVSEMVYILGETHHGLLNGLMKTCTMGEFNCTHRTPKNDIVSPVFAWYFNASITSPKGRFAEVLS